MVPAADPGEHLQEHHRPALGRILPDAHVQFAVSYLDMLAEPTRLRLLWALRDGELGVSTLAETAGCTPTAASQHLAKLRLAGLVDQRAEGRARYYRLRGDHIKPLLDEALRQAEHAVENIPHAENV
ncbi:winged helix-turn-helix transcriptional regulator [Actinospica sp. MGRD01-02]|uniref:Winged helix-turn-helix transcriptional regulator n=1 Tax=Actinospica acidithermotolerans TaxID=2828514 RepID=A0A941EER8_9ACTN|nr:metalloregulator ArsR/SmtB family transcription factor [Actinospica acidithermotolerans]MBR7826414.1 winged helix-turn-helix transcriptional regulator [Actinospica acidithermotolerans]